jgi:hypothetical protein
MTNDYQLIADPVDDATWDETLRGFDDANIYQTREYGVACWGEASLWNFRFLRGRAVVAMGQAVARRLPLLGGGLAYMPWGPVWRSGDNDAEVFRALVSALREEVSVRRGYLLRLAPAEWDTPENPCADILAGAGYERARDGYRTLVIDLAPGMEAIRAGLNRSWRRALKRAEQLGVVIEEGTGEHLYESFKRMYREMVARKGFLPFIDTDEFQVMQRHLPAHLKMHIMMARLNDKPVAALTASRMGEGGLGLLGATANDGLSSGAFHLVNMRMMAWLREQGARYYDFGGYDPDGNRGTAGFKDGLPGHEVRHLGVYEASAHPARSWLIHRAEQGRQLARRARTGAVVHHHHHAPSRMPYPLEKVPK